MNFRKMASDRANKTLKSRNYVGKEFGLFAKKSQKWHISQGLSFHLSPTKVLIPWIILNNPLFSLNLQNKLFLRLCLAYATLVSRLYTSTLYIFMGSDKCRVIEKEL